MRQSDFRFLPFDPCGGREDLRERWEKLTRIVGRGNVAVQSGERGKTALTLVLELLLHEVCASYALLTRFSLSPLSSPSLPFALRILSVSSSVWTEEFRHVVEASHNTEIDLESHPLLSAPLHTGEEVVMNEMSASSVCLLPGCPSPLSNFLALPIILGGQCVGVIALANSLHGCWSHDDLLLLRPFATMIGTLIILSEYQSLSSTIPIHSYFPQNDPGRHTVSPTESSSTVSPIVPFAHIHSPPSSFTSSMSSSLPPSTPIDSLSLLPANQCLTLSPSLIQTRISPPEMAGNVMTSAMDASRRKSDFGSVSNAISYLCTHSHPSHKKEMSPVTSSSLKDEIHSPQGNTRGFFSQFVTPSSLGSPNQNQNENKIFNSPHRRRHTVKEKSSRKIPKKKSNSVRRMEYMGRALVHVFESLSDGIVVFNESLQIITCNMACVTMMGFKDPLHLLSVFPNFDEILHPICRFVADQKITLKSSIGTMESQNEKLAKSEEWRSDLRNLLGMAKSSQRIRLEAMLKRNPNPMKSDDSPESSDSRSPDESSSVTEDSSMTQFAQSKMSGPSTGDENTCCSVDMSITSFSYKNETYFSAVFRDVTQDKLYREKDTLLAFLSHEIRNPVQAITLGTQLLLQKSRNHTTTTIAKDLYLAADLLYSVVTDTIDYVQISTRNFQPKMEVNFIFRKLQKSHIEI